MAFSYRLPIRKGSLLGGWSCLRQGLSGGRLLLGVLGFLQLFASVCAAGLPNVLPLSKFITGLFLFISTGGMD